MYGTAIEEDDIKSKEINVVCDVVYNPEETKLLREAKEAGCTKTIGGKGMLLWQGVAAYKLYTGLDMPVEEYKKYQAENQK